MGGLEGRSAVVTVVEGVIRKGLEIVAVCFHAHGAEGVEGGDDLVAGVVEDPVTITSLHQQTEPNKARGGHGWCWRTESSDTPPTSPWPG